MEVKVIPQSLADLDIALMEAVCSQQGMRCKKGYIEGKPHYLIETSARAQDDGTLSRKRFNALMSQCEDRGYDYAMITT